jgi:hypothetical protein
MKTISCFLFCGVVLALGAGRAQADPSCLGGSSSRAACVQGGDSMYGQNTHSVGQELMNSDSAANSLQGQTASSLLQNTGDSNNSVGNMVKHGGKKGRHHSSFSGPVSGGMTSISSSRKGHGSNDIRPVSQNSLGESVDYFGNGADRDVHGSLISCLKDSFGHKVCM